MSTKKRISNKSTSKRTKSITTNLPIPSKKYHIIENQSLDISLLNNNHHNNNNNLKYTPDQYIEFLKKCYEINNTIFLYNINKYKIVNNIFPENLYSKLILNNFICKNGEIYKKDQNDKKQYLTGRLYNPDAYYLEDYNDYNLCPITIFYFHNVPEEIGKLEMVIPKYIHRTYLMGHKLIYDKHQIKSGTVIINNFVKAYKFSVEKKLKQEYNLPIVQFYGVAHHPFPTFPIHEN